MNAELVIKDASASVQVQGDLDQRSLQVDFCSTISAADKQALTRIGALEVCLAGVERTDTAGLAWLLNMVRDLHQNNVQVDIRNAAPKLINLATLSGAQSVLTRENND